MPSFTKRYLDAARYQGDGRSRDERWDDAQPGLGLRITPGGKKTFILFYRVGRQRGARQRLVKLGTYGADMTLDQARDKARKWLAQARDRKDPYADARADAGERFSEVAAAFIEKYAKPRNRRWQETERVFKVYVNPKWGSRPIGDIARRDVIALLEKIADDHGGYMSNRVLAAVRRLFAWAVERDLIAASPAANVRPIAKEVSRDRVLSDAELRAFWIVTAAMDYPWGPFLRTLALTAQRRQEVAAMRWQDLDLASENPRWTLPREATKADRAHEVPLAPETAALLSGLPRHEGPHVFTTGVIRPDRRKAKAKGREASPDRAGDRPVSGFTAVKRRLDKAMLAALRDAAAEAGEDPGTVTLEAWKLHDLRRTAASTLARLGTPPHVVAAILNHSPGATQGITAVYNRHDYAAEKRAALSAWARYLHGLTDDAAPSNVVELAQATA